MHPSIKRSLPFFAAAAFPGFTPVVSAQTPAKSTPPATTQAFIKRLPTLPFREEVLSSTGTTAGRLKGDLVGAPLLVDADFAAKYENTPPSAPFMVAIPKSEDVTVVPGAKADSALEFVKIGYATPDKQAIEILRLFDFKVPMQTDPGDRLKACAHLLVTQGLVTVTKGYADAKYLEAYATKIATYDAVCLHAHMKNPKTGEHYAVKLVGVLHPKQPGGVMAFLMANTKLSDVKNPPDLASKGLGLQMIHSIRFIETTKTPAKP
ncbi:MAG TPA: hypothetical protein VK968_20140 [Roseimicrobium sp.]|nr:hypothetical protein [Roseimicrobium sp.]